MDMRRRRNLACGTLVLSIMAAVAFWLLFSPAVGLMRIQTWINGFGFWGPAVFFLFYILAVVVLIPGSVLALVTGLAYGMWGLPLALLAAATGASLSFLLARHLVRSRVQTLIRHHLMWRAFEQEITESGWRIVVLVRLSPLLPFNVQNYFFGITRIPFFHYLSATIFGIFPGTAVNVCFAAVGQAMTLGGLWHPLKAGLFMFGLMVTVAVGWTINHRLHAMLRNAGQGSPGH